VGSARASTLISDVMQLGQIIQIHRSMSSRSSPLQLERPILVLVGLAVVVSLSVGTGQLGAESNEQLEQLLRTLDGNNQILRRFAVSAIGELGSKGKPAVRALAKALGDKDQGCALARLWPWVTSDRPPKRACRLSS
jgi:HEAT repeat protein